MDDFRAVMELNVTAIWHLCKLCSRRVDRRRRRQRRQHRLDARARRLDAGQAGGLLRQQGRSRQPHPRVGVAVRPARRPGQRAVPGLVPVRADRRHGERRGRPAVRHRRTPRSRAWARPTSSTARCSSSPHPPARSSPVRASSSTAAGPPAEVALDVQDRRPPEEVGRDGWMARTCAVRGHATGTPSHSDRFARRLRAHGLASHRWSCGHRRAASGVSRRSPCSPVSSAPRSFRGSA